ncbi:MAG: ASCH domain-containing protein [Shimia sp.]
MSTLEDVRLRYPEADVFKFGDNETLCEDLLARVIAGRKTATCGAARWYDEEGDPLPEVGDVSIALHWDGRPGAVLRTTALRRDRFCDVTKDFALAEGEDDSLDGWRAGHRRYFERNGGWHPEMELICERFEVVELCDG